MAYKTFQYRMYPTRAQQERLQGHLDVCRAWYIMCLAERKYAWELEQRRVKKFELNGLIKHYRKSIPFARNVTVSMLRDVVEDVDEAFNGFYRRSKKGDKPGYPKFKGRRYFNSFGTVEWGKGASLDGRRIRITGVGRVAVRWHRDYEGVIKTARFVRKAGKWFVSLTCEIEDPKPLPETGRQIGIDFGINALVTLSDGTQIENPKWYRESQAKLRRIQRKIARAQRGSNNRKKLLKQVQHLHLRIKSQREDYLNRIVYHLTKDYDLIAIEDLQIQNMVKNKHLSKSILDAGWGFMKERLEQKASETGAKVIFVDPRYTSKTCSNCGHEFEQFGLSVRWVECPDCGLSLDRDHNAALNVLKRAGRALGDIT